MSQLDQYVNDQADDWTDGSSGAVDDDNELVIRYLDDALNDYEDEGFCLIDTSSIPDTDTIDSATFYWYHHEYLQPKNAGYSGGIKIYDNVSQYVTIYTFSADPTAGAKSHALESGELQYINKTGDTKFKFYVDEQLNKDRTWKVRAYDGYSGSSQQPRLVVNHSAASSGRSKTMILR